MRVWTFTCDDWSIRVQSEMVHLWPAASDPVVTEFTTALGKVSSTGIPEDCLVETWVEA